MNPKLPECSTSPSGKDRLILWTAEVGVQCILTRKDKIRTMMKQLVIFVDASLAKAQ